MRRWMLLLLVLPFCQGQDPAAPSDPVAAPSDPDTAPSVASSDPDAVPSVAPSDPDAAPSVASSDPDAADDVGSGTASGTGDASGTADEAWEYVTFLRELNEDIEDILQDRLTAAIANPYNEPKLVSARDYVLEDLIAVRDLLITRITQIRKGTIETDDCQEVKQVENLTTFRTQVMTMILELVQPGEVSVDQLKTVSTSLLDMRKGLSQVIMRILMLPPSSCGRNIVPPSEACEKLETWRTEIDDILRCARGDHDDPGTCAAPPMYNMQMIDINENFNEEIKNFYETIIGIVDEKERKESLEKMNQYKACRDINEELIKLLLETEDEEEMKDLVKDKARESKRCIQNMMEKYCTEVTIYSEPDPDPTCQEQYAEQMILKIQQQIDFYTTILDVPGEGGNELEVVRGRLISFIGDTINEKLSEIAKNKANGNEVDGDDQKKKVLDMVKGPLWMLVNATIFADVDVVKASILAINGELERKRVEVCGPTITVHSGDTCHEEEIKNTKLWLKEIDEKIIEASLFKVEAADEDTKKTEAILAFVDLGDKLNTRVSKLFTDGAVCREELGKVKTIYMPQLTDCLDELTGNELDFQSRTERITCAKLLRDQMDDRLLELLRKTLWLNDDAAPIPAQVFDLRKNLSSDRTKPSTGGNLWG